MVREHEHRIRRAARRGRRASHAVPTAARPRRSPGTAVSSTASVDPVERDRVRARPDARARDRAWRRGCRARGACAIPEPPVARRGTPRTPRARPRVGEVALDHDHIGIEREHLVDDGAVHHLGVGRRRPAPRAGSARSRRWRDRRCCPHSVSPKCTSLAVAIVARSRPAGCASVRTRAGSHVVGRRALDRRAGARCRARAR